MRYWCCAALLASSTCLVAQPAPRVTGEKVMAALPLLEKLAANIIAQDGTPGLAIAVVHNDEVVFLKGFGVRQAGSDAAIDADTVFQIASCSKPLASTVIAAAVGAGSVGWDDRLCDRLPEFQLHDPWITRAVRIRDMLCHRSGLPDHAGDLLEDLGYDRAEVLHRLRYLKKHGEFRVEYAYTNFGYTAAGEATARAAKTTWEELCAQKLYRPLGMTSTSSTFKDYEAARNRAVAHVKIDGKWTARYTRQPDAQSPAGGVSSSVRDMARYLRLQLGQGKLDGKQLVAARALAETHRPQVIAGYDPQNRRPITYGLGWNVGVNPQGLPFLNHSGAFSLGVRSMISYLPEEQLGIVVLSNAAPTGVPEGVSMTFYDLVLEGKPTRDWLPLTQKRMEQELAPTYQSDYTKRPAPSTPPRAAASYAGKYRNAYFGDLEIVAEAGKLTMKIGPKPLSLPLEHWNRDVYLYQPVGENAGGPASATFAIGASGQATQVRLQSLAHEADPTFERLADKK